MTNYLRYGDMKTSYPGAYNSTEPACESVPSNNRVKTRQVGAAAVAVPDWDALVPIFKYRGRTSLINWGA